MPDTTQAATEAIHPALLDAYRILLRIAARRAAAETPPSEPPPKVEAGTAPLAPASSSHPSTTARPLSFAEDGHA